MYVQLAHVILYIQLYSVSYACSPCTYVFNYSNKHRYKQVLNCTNNMVVVVNLTKLQVHCKFCQLALSIANLVKCAEFLA